MQEGRANREPVDISDMPDESSYCGLPVALAWLCCHHLGHCAEGTGQLPSSVSSLGVMLVEPIGTIALFNSLHCWMEEKMLVRESVGVQQGHKVLRTLLPRLELLMSLLRL